MEQRKEGGQTLKQAVAGADKARMKRMPLWSRASFTVGTNRTDEKEIEASDSRTSNNRVRIDMGRICTSGAA